jgi:hypothetical protein
MEDETNREVYIKGLVKICSRPKRGKEKRGREGERARERCTLLIPIDRPEEAHEKFIQKRTSKQKR